MLMLLLTGVDNTLIFVGKSKIVYANANSYQNDP